MVNKVGFPVQVTPFTKTEELTLTWELNGVVVLGLVAVKIGTLPEPLAPRPIAVFAFVHAKVAPATGLVKFTTFEAAPLQSVILLTGSTVGVGMIWILKDCGIPAQLTPLDVYVGITLTVPEMGAEVPF